MDKHVLLEAKAEIQRLRRENEILGAKVEVMNLFATVLHTQPAYQPMGACEDVAAKLQREHDRMEMVEKSVKPADAVPGPPDPPKGLYPREVG